MNQIKFNVNYYNIYSLKSLFYGFTNGFLLLVTGNSFNFWLTKEDINLTIIGLFSFCALPYSIKFIFASIVENTRIPPIKKFYSPEKSWLIIAYLAMTFCTFILSTLTLKTNLILALILMFLMTSCAVIIDIVLNKYRIENTPKEFIGQTSASYIFGYRIGMLCSGAGAIYLSAQFSWNYIYKIFSVVILIMLIINHFIKDQSNNLSKNSYKIKTNFLIKYFVIPFKHFKSLTTLLYVLLFIFLYRLADNMILVVLNKLLLDIGFNEVEIATAGKFFGITSALIGGIVAGNLIKQNNIKLCLSYFGLAHIASHFLYFMLLKLKNKIFILYILTGCEAFTAGMAMTALFSYISYQCRGSHIATQFAVLFSIIGLSRFFFPTLSGIMVEFLGWHIFFVIMIIISLPSIFIIKKIPG